MLNRYIQAILIRRMVFLPIALLVLTGMLFNELAAAGCFITVLLASWYLYRTEFLLIGLLVVFFLADNVTGPFDFADNLRFAVLPIGLVYLYPRGLLRSNPGNYFLPLSIYALIITFLFSPLGLGAMLRAAAIYLVPLCIFKVTELLYSNNNKAPVVLFLFLSGLLLLQVLVLPMGRFYLAGRFHGLMGNPNGLAMWVVFAYGLAHVLHKQFPEGIDKNYLRVFKVVAFLLVIFTGSRTALIALLVYEVFYLFLRLPSIRLIMLLSGIGIGIILWYIDLQSFLIDLGLGKWLRIDSLGSASGRTEVWAVALNTIAENPFLGRGPGFDLYTIDQLANSLYGENRPRQWYGVWSSYLSLLLNVGVVGILVLAWAVIKLMRGVRFNHLAFSFLAMVLTLAVSESWLAASMNAFTPLFFLYFAIQRNDKLEGP